MNDYIYNSLMVLYRICQKIEKSQTTKKNPAKRIYATPKPIHAKSYKQRCLTLSTIRKLLIKIIVC